MNLRECTRGKEEGVESVMSRNLGVPRIYSRRRGGSTNRACREFAIVIRIRWLVCIVDTVGCTGGCQYFGFSFGLLLSGARVRRNSLAMIVRFDMALFADNVERIKVAIYFERFSNFGFFTQGKMKWNLFYRFYRRK